MLVDVQALCRDCGFAQFARNAMGLAAQHHKRTGHTVDVESQHYTRFGDGDNPNFHDRSKPVVSRATK